MAHDPLDTSRIEREQAEAQERAIRSARIEVSDLNWVMANKQGRRFVARLLDRAGVWRTSFNTNALTMAFSEGTRHEGLNLVTQVMAHCPDRFYDMVKEFNA